MVVQEQMFMSMHTSTGSRISGASAVADMLREDHVKVIHLFGELEQAEDATVKQRIVETAVMELEVHAKLEEGIIYPAIRGEIGHDDLMDDALDVHHVVHGLIGDLKKMKLTDARYVAKFTLMVELVRSHHGRRVEEISED
jgi:hemerythrin superfamily protein